MLYSKRNSLVAKWAARKEQQRDSCSIQQHNTVQSYNSVYMSNKPDKELQRYLHMYQVVAAQHT